MKLIVGAKVGNENSGNFGHAGRPGKVGGSAPNSHQTVKARYTNPDDLPTFQEYPVYVGDYDVDTYGLPGGAHEDRYLKAICHDQGFDGLPDVMTEEEMDAHIAANPDEVVLYRGMRFDSREEAEQAQERFCSGDFYVGKGINGNGMYTAESRNDAYQYSTGKSGKLMQRMTLKPDAKIIDRKDVRDMIAKEPTQNGPIHDDNGRWAAAHGYDAIRIRLGAISNYIILNRTTVRVQKENYYPAFKRHLDNLWKPV